MAFRPATASAWGFRSQAMTSQAKRTVAELIDQIGFDAVDAGTLAEGGRKHQPGTPAYTDGLHTGELRVHLAA